MSYPDPDSRSAGLYQRARGVLAGGSTRITTYFSPYPLYAVSGEGCRITDADGVERLDALNNYMTLIHGHGRPEVVAALHRQVDAGVSFSLPTELEIALGELLCDRVRSFERIRFVNSGTEAVMTAIKAARAFTGRPMVAKAEGAYHGSYDPVEVSHDATPDNWGRDNLPARTPYSRGLPEKVMEDVIVFPFPDTEATLALLEPQAGRLAAIVVDPLPARIGFLRAPASYFQALRDFADRHGIVLIYDEVACFRVDHGGMQTRIGVDPDLTTMGKIIGGGLPVGAIAGRAQVMAVFDPSEGRPPAPHGGTFNANPMTMAAGLAAMELMTPAAFERLQQLGDRARAGLSDALRDSGIEGQVTGDGSLIKLHMTARPLTDFRAVYATPQEQQRLRCFFHALLRAGALIGPTGLMALSTAMDEADVDRLCTLAGESLAEVRRELGEAA